MISGLLKVGKLVGKLDDKFVGWLLVGLMIVSLIGCDSSERLTLSSSNS